MLSDFMIYEEMINQIYSDTYQKYLDFVQCTIPKKDNEDQIICKMQNLSFSP